MELFGYFLSVFLCIALLMGIAFAVTELMNWLKERTPKNWRIVMKKDVYYLQKRTIVWWSNDPTYSFNSFEEAEKKFRQVEEDAAKPIVVKEFKIN